MCAAVLKLNIFLPSVIFVYSFRSSSLCFTSAIIQYPHVLFYQPDEEIFVQPSVASGVYLYFTPTAENYQRQILYIDFVLNFLILRALGDTAPLPRRTPGSVFSPATCGSTGSYYNDFSKIRSTGARHFSRLSEKAAPHIAKCEKEWYYIK